MLEAESKAADAIRTIAIVGPGLIGGSFGLALRKAGFDGAILGVGRVPYVQAAVEVGAVDRITTLQSAAALADLLYLSGTVNEILEVLDQLPATIRPECLVTDVGSTKRVIEEKANRCLPPGMFIGGHPMAGKEKRGAENADPDLFCDRPYILTSESQSPIYLAFRYWLAKIGARVLQLTAVQHDETVAFSSHLPQLLSTALACTLEQQSNLLITSVFGAGLTDMIRLALSSPDLWKSILETNRDQVVHAVDTYIETLLQVRDALSTPELEARFRVANTYSYLLLKQ